MTAPPRRSVVELQDACPEGKGRNRCFVEQMGSWPAVRKLHADAYQEMLKKHGPEFAERVMIRIHRFSAAAGFAVSRQRQSPAMSSAPT